MDRGFYRSNIVDLVKVKLDKSNRIVAGIPTACFESKPNSAFSTREQQEKGDFVRLCEYSKACNCFLDFHSLGAKYVQIILFT